MKPLVLSFSVSRYPSSTFGQYIRKARLEKELTQKEVAEAIGVDEMTIVNWERLDGSPPAWMHEKLIALCRILDVSPEDFVRRRDCNHG